MSPNGFVRVPRLPLFTCGIALLCCNPEFATAAAAAALAAPVSRGVDFVKDIQPIFEANCYRCHGPAKQEAQFRLDSKEIAQRTCLDCSLVQHLAERSEALQVERTGARQRMRKPLEAGL